LTIPPTTIIFTYMCRYSYICSDDHIEWVFQRGWSTLAQPPNPHTPHPGPPPPLL
jgi:hypothetical protein